MRKLDKFLGKVKFEAVIGLCLLVAVVAGGAFFITGSTTNDTQQAAIIPPPIGDVGNANNTTENAPPGSELAFTGQGYSFVPIYSVFVPSKPVNSHTPQKPSTPDPANPSEDVNDDDAIEIPFDELPDDIKDILFPGWRDENNQDDTEQNDDTKPTKPSNNTGNQTDDEDDLWDYPEAPEEDLDPDDVEHPEDDDGFSEDGPQEENPDNTPDAETPDVGDVEDVDPTQDENEFPEDVPDDAPNGDWIDDWING